MSENQLTISNPPAFLQQYTSDAGMTKDLRSVMLPSFLRIIQAQVLSQEIRDLGVQLGDVILLPERRIVSLKSPRIIGATQYPATPPIPFVPVFFFKEWVLMNPIKLRGQKPWIRDRSRDPDSTIAKMAGNPNTREAVCPDLPTERMKYAEVLNYLVMPRIEDAPLLPVFMTFLSAEHSTGRKFANLIVARGPYPIYAGLYEFSVGIRTNTQGTWGGYDIANHATQPWIAENEVAMYAAMHAEMASKFERGEIEVDYESGHSDGSVGEPQPQATQTGAPGVQQPNGSPLPQAAAQPAGVPFDGKTPF